MKNQRLATELKQEIERFLSQRKSLSLAVINADGQPIASYAPFAESQSALLILVSELAHHTQALQLSTQASVMIMDDEADCDSVYARRRLQYEMTVDEIGRDTIEWQQGCEALLQRHGEIVSQLMQLGDFHLFKLSPQSGRFVKGFGRAYELPERALISDQLDHLRR